MTSNSKGTALVIGAGPGLGMSIAHRFGREGYEIALVSRSAERHPGYLESLTAAGITATAHPADVREHGALPAVAGELKNQQRTIEMVYYGPSAVDLDDAWPEPITRTDAAAVRTAMSWLYPGIDLVASVLPGMLERGRGTLLFSGGLSATTPMPMLGNLAVSSAALRNYVLTLNAALAEEGAFAGLLTIGGVVERGDIHRMLLSRPEQFGEVGDAALDPDTIADAGWDLAVRRDRAEVTFSAFG